MMMKCQELLDVCDYYNTKEQQVRVLILLFQGQSNYSSILLRVIAIMSQSGWPYLIIISTLYVIYLTSMLRILTFALTHVI